MFQKLEVNKHNLLFCPNCNVFYVASISEYKKHSTVDLKRRKFGDYVCPDCNRPIHKLVEEKEFIFDDLIQTSFKFTVPQDLR